MQVLRRLVSLAVSALIAVAVLVVMPSPASAAPEFTALVFSKTAGFRHGSIGAGTAAVQALGAANNFAVEVTEDAGAFTDANLARFRVVVFLSTTGDVLDAAQQAAFERYIRAGGGYAGVHAASDTEYDWPWYGGLVGAYFASHPAPQQATIVVADRVHPSTGALPERWSRFDEWYNFRANPRGAVHVLATLDETTYTGGGNGADHPIAWCQRYDGGRSWYTGGGHTDESFAEPAFRTHLLGGIRSAAGVVASDCGGTVTSNFQQVNLARGVGEVGEPMSLTVLPDRSVLHTSRDGTVRHTDADGATTIAATIPVYSGDEEGMQGIKADPEFATNRFVYLFYAPPLATPGGGAPETRTDLARWDGVNRLARYVVRPDGTIDTASARTVLDVPTSRGMCCHVGGDIDFDAAGNLYLSTGDDTNPFASEGYTPIDERTDRNPAFDAQRTAGNSNDLRGKVLRIKVAGDGSYTVPAGNMFAPGTPRTRPEIYAMGFRNPFRMSVDKATGAVYLGDYGPDAGTASPTRGPAAQVEFARITRPGFYGWPYCTGSNDAYVDHDFATGASGARFDCAGGVTNNSPNNTGITQLPPAIPAWLPYTGSQPVEFEGGGLSPMAGPVYRFDPASTSEVAFPQYYDGTFFAGEFGRRWIKNIVLDGTGEPLKINPFPWSGTQVMDLEFGPDGALYVLDYGTGFFNGDEFSALYRIEYARTGQAPQAFASADRTSGATPLTVAFSSAGTFDPDGNTLAYAWDLDGNGSTDSTEANPTTTYTTNGRRVVTLRVTDTTGKVASANVTVTVGNTAPTVRIDSPPDGRVFTFGELVDYRVTVTDPEDGTIDCTRVRLTSIFGHDAHGHPSATGTGCSGTIRIAADGEHGATANVFGVLDAEYTDNGANGQPALTTHDQHTLQPAVRQAEHFSTSSGIQLSAPGDAHGGRAVGYVDDGDWIAFRPYDLSGVTSVTARVGADRAGSRIELRTGSATGPLVSTLIVPATGGFGVFRDVTAAVAASSGPGELHLVFRGDPGALFDVDEFTLTRGPTGPIDPAPGTDLALGRPAAASTLQGPDLPAGHAVDGRPDTRWSSQPADPQWISVDLGATRALNRVTLTWEAAFGSAYEIQVSDDGQAWRQVRAVTGGDGGVDDLTGLTGSGRYVRMYGTQRGTGYGYSLWSFEVYAT